MVNAPAVAVEMPQQNHETIPLLQSPATKYQDPKPISGKFAGIYSITAAAGKAVQTVLGKPSLPLEIFNYSASAAKAFMNIPSFWGNISRPISNLIRGVDIATSAWIGYSVVRDAIEMYPSLSGIELANNVLTATLATLSLGSRIKELNTRENLAEQKGRSEVIAENANRATF